MSNRDLFFQHVGLTAPEPIGIEVVSAEGIYLYGPNGERWIDMISGICVMNVGHGAPEVVAAIREQSSKYLHTMVYGESIMSPQVQYARKLTEILGPGYEKVYFLNGGTEANEAALKVAKKYTGRSKIVSFVNAYHGSTHGSLSVSGNPDAKEGYGPLLPEVYHIPYNDFDALDMIDDSTACIIIEAIQGAGGVILPKEGFLEAVINKCQQTGTLVIMDEIQTGFGRTGKMFAHQAFGVKPDILTLGKALGGGLPMGAFVSRAKIMEVIQRKPILGHINTFGGGPVACAAGLASLEKIEHERLLETIPQKEEILRVQLKHPAILEVRGKGLMFAILFKDYETTDRIRRKALELGLLTIGFLNIPNGLRICPPLTIQEKELKEACRILLKAIEEEN